MDKQEIKKYIIANWKVSNGKRITEMLRKYWSLESSEKNINEDVQKTIETAKEVFRVDTSKV